MPVSNSLTKKTQNEGITAFLSKDAVKAQIDRALGSMNSQRFITAVVSAVNANPNLKKCTNQSIFTAALLGESLNLSPSPQLGQYYLVPYGNQASFQLGYKGYIQLAIRSGQYKKINVVAIKKGELVRFDPLNEEIEVNLIEDEEERENTPTAGFYAMFEYTNGFRKAIYWSKAKMEAHARKYSKAYNNFWGKDFDGMAYKTMIRQLLSKWGMLSADLIKAYEGDMAVINEDGSANYVDTEEVIYTPAQEVTEQPKPQQADNLPPAHENPQEEPKTAANDGNLF